jgi:hypothetical protein
MTMGRYYTEEQLDEFMTAYLAKYPETIERWFYMMDHQGVIHHELGSQINREMLDVANSMPFFTAYADKLQRELLESAGGEFQVNVPFEHKGVMLKYDASLLVYHDHIKRRLADQIGLSQAGFELFMDVAARLRGMHAQARKQAGDEND